MTMNLNSLNDDCLRIIINFLNFRDQILLSQVSQRFQYLIDQEWNCKRVVQKIFLSELFWKSNKIEKYFPKFINSVSAKVEDLELNTYHLKRWGPLIKKLRFPKLRSCTAHLAQSDANTDDQVMTIVRCFPSITKLTLRGHITGKHVWELKNLQELHFDVHDVKLKIAHLQQLYKKVALKKLTLFSEDHKTSCGFSKAIEPLYLCQTLEELRVAGDIVHTTISKIKKIKSLRKLTVGVLLSFRFIPYPLEDMGEYFGLEVSSITFNNVVRDRADYLKGLNSMVNLRKLVFFEDSITSKQLRYISLQLSRTLEEFYYLKCGRSYEDVEKFVYLVSNCTRLRVLDVSGTSVDVTLITRTSELLNRHDRQQKLLLRCANTKVNPSDMQNLRLASNLEISFKKQNIDLPEEYFFQVVLKDDTV